jgi:DMSO/TMAO reductase YedYZ molybdopterin-dependent catalytic subunit
MAIHRRTVLQTGVGVAIGALSATNNLPVVAQADTNRDSAAPSRPLLTKAKDFRDVSRAKPHPSTLSEMQLAEAKLTPDTWQLEITGEDKAIVPEPRTVEAGTAITLDTLHELAKKKTVRVLKGMQCLNISQPLGQGLWEGVLLRDVLGLTGKFTDVRRVYYWGHRGTGPMFRSSLSYTQWMENPPGEPPPFLAFRLNGEPLPLSRGGPVRMVVPWSYGFKSIKWLQKIVLTSDYQINDTYAEQNNDPESRMKTAAYLENVPQQIKAGRTHTFTGSVVSGLSGLERVECWIRPAGMGNLTDDDPAWQTAEWLPAKLDSEPSNWANSLPEGVNSKDVFGFDSNNGKPKSWPLPYSVVGWSLAATNLAPGKYELRARSAGTEAVSKIGAECAGCAAIRGGGRVGTGG